MRTNVQSVDQGRLQLQLHTLKGGEGESVRLMKRFWKVKAYALLLSIERLLLLWLEVRLINANIKNIRLKAEETTKKPFFLVFKQHLVGLLCIYTTVKVLQHF